MDIIILENFPEVERIDTDKPVVVKIDREAWLEHLKNGYRKYKAAKERAQGVNLLSLDSNQKLSVGIPDARQAEVVVEALTSKKIFTVTGKELDKGGLALVINHEEQYS